MNCLPHGGLFNNDFVMPGRVDATEHVSAKGAVLDALLTILEPGRGFFCPRDVVYVLLIFSVLGEGMGQWHTKNFN